MDAGVTVEIVAGGAGLIGTLIGCTWTLASKAGAVVQSNKNLRDAVNGLSATMGDHIQDSNRRDRENEKAHAALSRCCDSNVESIKNIGKRLDAVELKADNSEAAVGELNTRVAVVETKIG